MESNKAAGWQDDAALHRYQMIAPLLDPSTDQAAKLGKRESIAEQNGISVRTLYRYEKQFRENGFSGLKPADRTMCPSPLLPDNYEELVAEAIQLRKEVPKRSVEQIILILELEGRVAPGVLKRSTLQSRLYAAGYGAKQLKTVTEARESSSKRFCKPHRMMLVQGDIKYGPVLPAGKDGKKVHTYLSSLIDDHSRFILYSRFYATQEGDVVEDTFRKGILLYGKFDACYLDNGAQYVSKQLKLSLAKLGIRIHHAPPRSGKSKGKVEKFHQVVDKFLREVKLKKPKTVEDLNHYWEVYLDFYQNDAHDGIREYYESLGVSIPSEGITPRQEWDRDSRPLTYIDTSVVAEAFRHHEKRKVDKGACISFQGRKYETKPSLIGYKVDISYDPAAPELITVSYPGMVPFEAHPLEIREYCGKQPAIPISMQEPETSRLLDALEKQHKERQAHAADALSFAEYGEEGRGHV